jgi:hypothetical protein
VGIIQPQSLLEWEKDRAVACLVYKMDRWFRHQH